MTHRTRVSNDPKTTTRVPGGSQTGFTGGSASHRANPGGGAARVQGQSRGGGMSARAQKSFGVPEKVGNVHPVGYPAVLNMKKARAAAGFRTIGDFRKRGG